VAQSFAMQGTNEWVHFTSADSYQRINEHGAIKLSGNTSPRYDGVLVQQYAPRGVWFNCNFFRNELLSLTVYPERANAANVLGLVTRLMTTAGSSLPFPTCLTATGSSSMHALYTEGRRKPGCWRVELAVWWTTETRSWRCDWGKGDNTHGRRLMRASAF
jgi:hypothetical protein